MFYKKINYPDGDFYIELFEDKKEFVFRINSYEDLWELNHLIEVLNCRGIVPTIIIPNLISSQADKRFKENHSFGYKLVHDFLGKLNANFIVFHPHQDMCSLLSNVQTIDNHDFIYEVLAQIKGEDYDHNAFDMEDKLILTSTDSGGFKPLIKLADKLDWQGETFSASKSRKYEGGKSKLIQQVDRQDFEGKDILIVDDICVYGGTFKGLSKMLKERNCGKLYLAVSHITVEDLGQDPVTNYFDKVFTTNSKYGKYHTEDGTFNRYGDANFTYPENLEIINLF